ncbi:MAG: hypothetical protein VZR36_09040 [Prevotella sp.]|nr:hypothetical protein [Prevotella sp.]
MITQEEYLKNRIKLQKEKTVWNVHHENIDPDALISRINEVKEEIMNSAGVDEESIEMCINASDEEYPSIEMEYEQWESMEEYEQRLVDDEERRKARLMHLQLAIMGHFDEVCEFVDTVRENQRKLKEKNDKSGSN